MINYNEILGKKSLGIKNSQIAYSCSCSRATVINTLKRAEESNLTWEKVISLVMNTRRHNLLRIVSSIQHWVDTID